MTPLFPAIRNALDVLGISPPGHRDTMEDVGRKLAAWEQLRAAVDDAEDGLTTAYLTAVHALSCHPDATAVRGEALGLRFAADLLGLTDLPTAGSPTHVYLSTACLHARADGRPELHDYCANRDGQAGPKKPAQCKWCDARCGCTCHGEGQ